MFPTPIAKTAPWVQRTYKWLLPVALVLWLLPLIGIAVTSIRPSSDLAAGNYFGWPSGFNFIENYSAVFENSNIGWYILNSFKVTIPTVIGAVGLSCLTGYALAVYKFRPTCWCSSCSWRAISCRSRSLPFRCAISR